MIIEESDFRLEQQGDYDTYDLELLYIVNAKDADKRREEFRNCGYNMSFEKCMRLVINYRLSKRIDTTSLSQFVKEYKEEREKLSKLASLK